MLLALKGAPLSVLVYMTHDPRPVGPVELAAATGYSRPTIHAALRRLLSLGLAIQLPERTDAWTRVDVKISYIDTPIYTTTTTTLSSSNTQIPPPLTQQIATWHAEEIGPVTPAIRRRINVMADRHHDATAWRDAFTAAAVHGKRSFAYVLRCVKNAGTDADRFEHWKRNIEDY